MVRVSFLHCFGSANYTLTASTQWGKSSSHGGFNTVRLDTGFVTNHGKSQHVRLP